MTAVTEERLRPLDEGLRALAQQRRLALGGGAVDESRAGAFGALALSGDPVSEATRMTAIVAGRE